MSNNKNKFQNLITTALLAIFSAIFTLAPAFAATPTNISDRETELHDASFPFQDVKPCTTPEQDQTYVRTIVEEPLMPYTEFNDGRTDLDFQRFTCYRNILIRIDTDGKILPPASYLGDKCSPSRLQEAITNPQITFRCQEVGVMLAKGGTTLLEGYISTIFQWAGTIVIVLSVLVITISGIQISAAGGDSQAVDGAKARIIKSISGLAVLFLAWIILRTANPNFFT